MRPRSRAGLTQRKVPDRRNRRIRYAPAGAGRGWRHGSASATACAALERRGWPKLPFASRCFRLVLYLFQHDSLFSPFVVCQKEVLTLGKSKEGQRSRRGDRQEQPG